MKKKGFNCYCMALVWWLAAVKIDLKIHCNIRRTFHKYRNISNANGSIYGCCQWKFSKMCRLNNWAMKNLFSRPSVPSITSIGSNAYGFSQPWSTFSQCHTHNINATPHSVMMEWMFYTVQAPGFAALIKFIFCNHICIYYVYTINSRFKWKRTQKMAFQTWRTSKPRRNFDCELQVMTAFESDELFSFCTKLDG